MMSRIAPNPDDVNYRFGFNGKEMDHEVKGATSSLDYGMRIYDPRVGRFLSVDPLKGQYPMLSPYQYASNRPIDGIDRDGLEHVSNIYKLNYQTGETVFQKIYVDWKQKEWSEDNLLIIGSKAYNIGKDNPEVAAKAYLNQKLPESGKWSDRYADNEVDSYAGGPNPFWWVRYEYTREDLYYEDVEFWGKVNEGINTALMALAPLEAIHQDLALSGSGRANSVRESLEEGAEFTKADITRISVNDKLYRYLLNAEHAQGASKANFFEKALGFTKSNASKLAEQLVFDEQKAFQTEKTQYGTKYNQVIAVKGANGRIIDINTAWIKNEKGEVRLVTATPVKTGIPKK